jgi:Dockerin type I domain
MITFYIPRKGEKGMYELKTQSLKHAVATLIVCFLLVAAVITSIAFSVQRVEAQPAEDVDVAVVSITHVVYYPAVYVWKGQMRIGDGNASPAMLVYNMNISRLDSNFAIPFLEVDVLLERANMTLSPAETFSIVNSTSIMLAGGGSALVTLTWCEDGNTSKLPASRKGVTWMIGCLANVTSPGVNDTDLSNNLLWNDSTTAYTGLTGDINGDGYVDIFDAILLANQIRFRIGDPWYNADADMNRDSTIDVFDAILLANNFGKHMP